MRGGWGIYIFFHALNIRYQINHHTELSKYMCTSKHKKAYELEWGFFYHLYGE
jgi:hypothetical protein